MFEIDTVGLFELPVTWVVLGLAAVFCALFTTLQAKVKPESFVFGGLAIFFTIVTLMAGLPLGAGLTQTRVNDALRVEAVASQGYTHIEFHDSLDKFTAADRGRYFQGMLVNVEGNVYTIIDRESIPNER